MLTVESQGDCLETQVGQTNVQGSGKRARDHLQAVGEKISTHNLAVKRMDSRPVPWLWASSFAIWLPWDNLAVAMADAHQQARQSELHKHVHRGSDEWIAEVVPLLGKEPRVVEIHQCGKEDCDKGV